MNKNEMEGKWKQMKGRVQEKWGKLTEDDIDQIKGRREVLVGKLQERYGHAQDRAEEEADEFFENLEERAQFKR